MHFHSYLKQKTNAKENQELEKFYFNACIHVANFDKPLLSLRKSNEVSIINYMTRITKTEFDSRLA